MQNIKLNCPKDPTEILDRLMAAGYNAYVVGGCVRDTLLGIAAASDTNLSRRIGFSSFSLKSLYH